MVMQRVTFPSDLEEGLNTHFGMQYRQLRDEWADCFDIEKSKKQFEEDVLNYGFGAAPVKCEGAAISYDEGGEGWTSRYTHETIALAFSITEEAVEDNLYQRLGPKYAKALARALKQTKEVKGANILNNATTAGFTGGDGSLLLVTNHALQGGGTASNKLATPADLAETPIEDLLIQIRKAKDDRGIPIAMSPTRMILPPELEYIGCRLLKSELRPSTADNDINAVRTKGVFSTDPAIITRLTDADAWFIKTDCPDGLKHFRRTKVARGTEEDFDTGNMRYKARERYSFGWSDWRGVWGTSGG